jgi:hypothetical protein
MTLLKVHFRNKFEIWVHLVGFIIRIFVTMYGHMNVKIKIISVLLQFYVMTFYVNHIAASKLHRIEGSLMKNKFGRMWKWVCRVYFKTFDQKLPKKPQHKTKQKVFEGSFLSHMRTRNNSKKKLGCWTLVKNVSIVHLSNAKKYITLRQCLQQQQWLKIF